ALHPVWGLLLLFAILFTMFQLVFFAGAAPADAIDAGFNALGKGIDATLPPSFFRDLLSDGIIAGVGAVVKFLPQILILF
ncbi:ferrous iron transporter B, partial [Enterococcus lactis]